MRAAGRVALIISPHTTNRKFSSELKRNPSIKGLNAAASVLTDGFVRSCGFEVASLDDLS